MVVGIRRIRCVEEVTPAEFTLLTVFFQLIMLYRCHYIFSADYTELHGVVVYTLNMFTCVTSVLQTQP